MSCRQFDAAGPTSCQRPTGVMRTSEVYHLIFRQDEIGSNAWRRKLLLPRTKPIHIYLQPIAQFKQTENKQGLW